MFSSIHELKMHKSAPLTWLLGTLWSKSWHTTLANNKCATHMWKTWRHLGAMPSLFHTPIFLQYSWLGGEEQNNFTWLGSGFYDWRFFRWLDTSLWLGMLDFGLDG